MMLLSSHGRDSEHTGVAGRCDSLNKMAKAGTSMDINQSELWVTGKETRRRCSCLDCGLRECSGVAVL